MTAMEEVASRLILFVIPLIEVFGALVIALGAGRTIVRFLLTFLGIRRHRVDTLRLQLGRALVTGLEFQVAADILKTVLDPTWEDIGLLAAIVALRTLLNFFLEREIAELNHHVEDSLVGSAREQE